MAGSGQPITVTLARWCATHPWRAIAGWLVFLVVCVGAGSAVGMNKGQFSDFWIGEAGRAEAIAADAGLTPAPVERVLITAEHRGKPDAAAAEDAARDVRRRMENLPAVVSVAAPKAAADGSALMVAVTLRGDKETAKEDVDALLEQTEAVRSEHRGLRVEQTGSASLSNGVNDKQGKDLQRTEAISLPVTFLILFVVFGSVLAAGIPVLLALFAFAGAVGLYGLASWITPDAGGAALSVIFMLGMAVGVDYSLFYLKRAREERERTGGTISHAAAVELAAATSGRAVVDSGLAVALALGGLYLMDDVIFSSIATGAILVTLVAVAGSLTVLPALLAKLGHRTDGRRARRRAAQGARAPEQSRMWSALLRPVMRRPLVTLLAGLAATAALALPTLGMKLGTEGKDTFPDSVAAMATYDRLTAAYPADGTAHLVVVRSDAAHADEAKAALRRLADRTSGNELFARDGTAPRLRTSEDGRSAMLTLPVPYAENSEAADRSLALLRGELVPATVGRVAGTEAAVSGEIAYGADYAAHQEKRLPWVILFVSLATLALMYAAFRSVVMAVLSVLLNLAAVLVSWGVLTLVFQGTWAEGLLGFESTGFVGSRTPLLVFAILVGLSTDYQIFVVNRIKEAVRRGAATREAVVDGITGSASVVTSAAVIMVSVFVSFLFIDRIEMKQIAVGLTVAVLFDAIVLRALILPSAMALLGDRCWGRPRTTAPGPETPPGDLPRPATADATPARRG
ncbi:MMPL family transporter [Streptomyces sp. ISL-99]|uniref:MMPL family transporter n=1 Tax=Streptomyces sp. ISL-99 TaxID=2819193 RepID=UPI001BE8AD5C|nr:MMPL family transporter [Streptomyces sp. ISL-99]MBT2526922.1 MMPL family transporter [Streptomyces sp. ISL-99]